ncbi:MAG: hypothetical protein QN152_00510 [Armatimonadota bacterium]|nr:hypothetical protein [Armatimonadota bacterium]MDR7463307.1 hypothetical protein [Armatimonadota bacterium]MDR7468959.1 hypothetical protein [Armatimonadota bacterium]MDR7474004.1 hypothetical protein [Armatimonadota bacterium]MDR7537999.1 hypothetical protein [Armatimonadota bacterium]
MSALPYARAWLAWKLHRDEAGQDAVEYVAMLGAVALFLVVAAFALQPALTGAVTAIVNWMGQAINPPAIP